MFSFSSEQKPSSRRDSSTALNRTPKDIELVNFAPKGDEPVFPAEERQQYSTDSSHVTSTMDSKLAMELGAVSYADKFVSVHSNAVVIHGYYFPLMRSKVVYLKPGTTVATNKQLGLSWTAYKAWGMGLTNIWWSLDNTRITVPGIAPVKLCAVLQIEGETLRKGFSLERGEEGWKALTERMRACGGQVLTDKKND